MPEEVDAAITASYYRQLAQQQCCASWRQGGKRAWEGKGSGTHAAWCSESSVALLCRNLLSSPSMLESWAMDDSCAEAGRGDHARAAIATSNRPARAPHRGSLAGRGFSGMAAADGQGLPLKDTSF